MPIYTDLERTQKYIVKENSEQSHSQTRLFSWNTFGIAIISKPKTKDEHAVRVHRNKNKNMQFLY